MYNNGESSSPYIYGPQYPASHTWVSHSHTQLLSLNCGQKLLQDKIWKWPENKANTYMEGHAVAGSCDKIHTAV